MAQANNVSSISQTRFHNVTSSKKLHPDLNPGNPEAEEKFKEVAGAYDLVGDADKRAKFDRGEIDAAGAERPRQNYYRDYSPRVRIIHIRMISAFPASWNQMMLSPHFSCDCAPRARRE